MYAVVVLVRAFVLNRYELAAVKPDATVPLRIAIDGEYESVRGVNPVTAISVPANT